MNAPPPNMTILPEVPRRRDPVVVPVLGDGTSGGYPWAPFDILHAADLNAAISNATNVSTADVKTYGAIMDGASHPLSTCGYATLAAAQAVYPHATSLSDEIDWCAIQAAVNALLTIIRFPAGTAIINRPVVSSVQPIVAEGAGMGATIIVQTTIGADGWDHTGFQFQCFGMELRCQGVGGTAINCNFTGPGTLFTIRDVSIGGYGSSQTNYWHDGIHIIGCSRGTIDHVYMTGIQPGGGRTLASVGNAVYLAPTTTPAPAFSAIVQISNCFFSWYHTGIVLDSSGRDGTNDIQGVVMDWVNCQKMMQFISILANIVELVVDKCQYSGYGPVISGADAQSVSVWNCFLIAQRADAFSVASELSPAPDLFHLAGGSNFWVGNNRFLIQGATLGYIFNLTSVLEPDGTTVNYANSLVARDNSILVNPDGAAVFTGGFMHIANGSHHNQESGTTFGNWDAAWPYVVNDNAQGGTSNVTSFGSLAVTAATGTVPFDNDQWQSKGGYITWDYNGPGVLANNGGTALVNSRGTTGQGGFYFYNVASDPAATPVLLAQIGAATSTSPLTPLTLFNQQVVCTQGVTVTSSTGPSWRSGTGTPSGVLTGVKGGMFSRSDGAVGTTLYVCQGGTTWNPIAGV